jgi:hypothetical protein
VILNLNSASRKGFIEQWQGFDVLVVLGVVVGYLGGSVVGIENERESQSQLSCGYCG